MSDHNSYQNPLTGRYASKEMQYAFSDDKRFKLWRKLWIALAESEMELGLNVTQEQVDELKEYADNIDYELAEKVTLKIAIPEELIQNRRVFKVVRVHNGVVEELETEVVDGNAVFSSDAFSTYALTYYDKMPIIAIVAIVVGAVAVVAVGGYFAFRALGKKKEEEA